MIGEKLRQERERQHLTIKDVEQGTSIRSLYLDAIEQGDYKTLPGDVYAKGFIRNYANFLHLDADAAVRQYNEENHPEEVARQEAAQKAVAEPPKPSSPTFAEKPSYVSPEPSYASEEPFAERANQSQHRQAFLVGLAVVVVLAFGGYFLLSGSDEPATREPQARQTQPARPPRPAAKPEPAARPQAQQAPANNQTKPASQQNYTDAEVTAKFTDRCWILVTGDGQTLYEGMMEKGQTQTWKANKEIHLRVGNAGAIDVTFNGQGQGSLGNTGEVVERTYALQQGNTASATAQRN